VLQTALGGWQVSGILQFQSGSPLTIGRNGDNAGIGVSQFEPYEVSGDPILPMSERAFSEGASDSNFYFRTTDGSGSPLFTTPAPGTFSGTQNRNSLLHGPGFQSWNFGLFKEFAFTERHRLQLRGEFFNLPNHPNLNNPNTDPRNSTFGKITSKADQNRNIQVSLRYSF
jgi:hypothetical protein